MRRLVSLILLLGALALAGCSDDALSPFIANDPDAPFVPVLVSRDTAVGDLRLILTLDARGAAPALPAGTTLVVRLLDGTPAGFRFRSQAEPQRVQGPAAEYLVLLVNFDRPGFWAVEVVATLPDGERLTSGRLVLEIDEQPDGLRAGDRAIASHTETASGVPLEAVSIDDALAAGRPFVVVFTTLRACPHRDLCARALEQVQRLSIETGVLGIHVTPLEIEEDGSVLPSPSGVLTDWKLANDPWIFVVGGDGVIALSLELISSDDALRQALFAVVDGS